MANGKPATQSQTPATTPATVRPAIPEVGVKAPDESVKIQFQIDKEQQAELAAYCRAMQKQFGFAPSPHQVGKSFFTLGLAQYREKQLGGESK